MSAKILECLYSSSEIADLFWEWCEFSALEEPAPDWIALVPNEPLQVVGRDACGGRFCLYPATTDYSGRLLYIDSEGRAGVIADSLSNGLRLMISLPTWRDCLKFSGGGVLEEMKRVQIQSEAHLQTQRPDVDECRRKLCDAFGLTNLPNPVDALYRSVLEGADIKVVATKDGWPYEGLFNTFVV